MVTFEVLGHDDYVNGLSVRDKISVIDRDRHDLVSWRERERAERLERSCWPDAGGDAPRSPLPLPGDLRGDCRLV